MRTSEPAVSVGSLRMQREQALGANLLEVSIGAIEFLYILSVLGVSLHGIHALWLTWVLVRTRGVPAEPALDEPTEPALDEPAEPAPDEPAEWPGVTVQLPIYNERHVAERLIDAVCALEYPHDRLLVQVLDDSTDATVALVDDCVRRWQRRGRNVCAVRRTDRAGYKAGALAHALPFAQGDYVAIFDADFLPEAGFLKKAMAPFCRAGSDRIAFVQARWEHLNRNYSTVTRSQALALDGHFGVEQPARFQAGLAFGFNGSAGIWRRRAIEDPQVGGWQADTLCEDLDLAYRAQLAGWRGHFLVGLAAPAEVPPQLLAFKRQQARWARGSIQTLRKLSAHVWNSGWTLGKRLAALFHLGNYLVHPLLLLLAVTLALLTLAGEHTPALLGVLSLASAGPPILYAIAERTLHPDVWKRNWAAILPLSMFGIGLSLNNTVAIVRGLRHAGGAFERTPKFDVVTRSDSWRASAYRLQIGWQMVAEVALALLSVSALAVAIERGDFLGALYVGLFAASFVTVVLVGMWQARKPFRQGGEARAVADSSGPGAPAPG